MYGLSQINIELTNRCNKKCWMCGRREREHLYGDIYNQDIPFEYLQEIAKQISPNIIVALHNNGEPLLYPKFKEAVKLFPHCITNVVTNGKLLLEKIDEIIDVLDTMSISIFENDIEADEQYEIIKGFLRIKGDRKPYTTLRLIGDVDENKYKIFNQQIVKRTLHDPKGSINYKKSRTVPESGICRDFLNHLAIDSDGNVSCCVRFDPEGELVLGNLKTNHLYDCWWGNKRKQMKILHISGKRKEIPYCGNKCEYWGIPG
jgi:radical SAM protein with 4Fe4S-binding SPASM domain